MTAIRSRQEHRTILDFSTGKHSKNKIKQLLRQCNLSWISENDSKACTIFINEIKVGMYTITIHLPFDSSCNWNRLRDYKDFEISIQEEDSNKSINLKKDYRFSNQYWVNYNFFGRLRANHLVDIILHCQRLDRLKAFL